MKVLNQLPDSFELEELIEKLIFIQKVEKGLLHSKKGEVDTTAEVKELLSHGKGNFN